MRFFYLAFGPHLTDITDHCPLENPQIINYIIGVIFTVSGHVFATCRSGLQLFLSFTGVQVGDYILQALCVADSRVHFLQLCLSGRPRLPRVSSV